MVVGILAGGIVVYLITRHFIHKNPSGDEAMKLIPIHENQDSLSVLRQIRDNQEILIPAGTVYDDEVDVTDAIMMFDGINERGGREYLNWTSCDVINKGPDPVYVDINDWKNPRSSLTIGQSMNVDLKKRGAIKKLYLKCDSGNTATVGIHYMK